MGDVGCCVFVLVGCLPSRLLASRLAWLNCRRFLAVTVLLERGVCRSVSRAPLPSAGLSSQIVCFIDEKGVMLSVVVMKVSHPKRSTVNK